MSDSPSVLAVGGPAAARAPRIRRVDVLGVGVSALTMPAAVAEIGRWIEELEPHYVCVTGVHGVMESQRDAQLKEIHNHSGLTTTDGTPLVWCARWAARGSGMKVSRVYGPDLMLALLERSADSGWSSFFYGGGPGTAELLDDRMRQRFPGLQIAGTYTPPFRPLTAEEADAVTDLINDSGADIVWVGLSTPKQERWMAEFTGRLNAPVLIGVGAAFDIHAGTLAQAPHWMQRSGTEWAYRLMKEPRRLWRRYLRNNPRFVVAILRRPPRLL